MVLTASTLPRTALQLAELLRRGEISSAELTERSLTRIAEHNPKLQAFVTVTEWRARRAAKKADALLVRVRRTGDRRRAAPERT